MQYKRDDQNLMQPSINKKEYLQGMLGRLENEVKHYLDSCWENNQKDGRSIGFWGMVRLLCPVIESFGQVKYPEIRRSWEYSAKVLKDLDVPYPKISWKLFRDCLIHGDEMLNVINDKDELYSGWNITFGGGHLGNHLQPTIDVDKLYYDLYSLIDNEIKNADPNDVIEFRAIRFSEKQLKSDPELKDEYHSLFGI